MSCLPGKLRAPRSIVFVERVRSLYSALPFELRCPTEPSPCKGTTQLSRETSMGGVRPHGNPIPHSIGLGDVPAMTTRSLRSAQVEVSRMVIGADKIGMTALVPPEDSFIVAVYLSPVEYHELWSRGRPV